MTIYRKFAARTFTVMSMFQLLKESWRENLWNIMGKMEKSIPADYSYPITEVIYDNIPSLAFPINTHDLPLRGQVVISNIILRDKMGGNSTYMRIQGWNLVIKMIERGQENLARWLDLELEALDVS